MSDEDLQTALAWIQARLDRELTIDTGTVIPRRRRIALG
jgi:hypothetical protein